MSSFSAPSVPLLSRLLPSSDASMRERGKRERAPRVAGAARRPAGCKAGSADADEAVRRSELVSPSDAVDGGEVSRAAMACAAADWGESYG